MLSLASYNYSPIQLKSKFVKNPRVESIDLLRGVVMIIMTLDHVRDYFHADAFVNDPTDLEHTTVILFFTRWITHFSAPVFIFLAGTSAYLYGRKKTKKEVSKFLFTRGLWLMFLEIFVISLVRTFNPLYPYLKLQVIWAIGLCMIALSGLIYFNRRILLGIGVVLIAGHNLLDGVHVHGHNLMAFIWSTLHEPNHFAVGGIKIFVLYPVLPWLGVMILGYGLGCLYTRHYSDAVRKKFLLLFGLVGISLFIILRSLNVYGDPLHWSLQKSFVFNILSFLNVTKYPPSFLYILMTLGPAFIFLALMERPLNALTSKIIVFGRVPMFYYLLHLLLIHTFAAIAAVLSGYSFSDMVLSGTVYESTLLKGYGFKLPTVYEIWIALVIVLYPCCRWYAGFKRKNQSNYRWLKYV